MNSRPFDRSVFDTAGEKGGRDTFADEYGGNERGERSDHMARQVATARHIEAQAVTLMFVVASLGLITGLLLARQ